jgi:hypothetical protein
MPSRHYIWPSCELMPPEARTYIDPSDGQCKRNVPRPPGGADLNGERVAVYEVEPRHVSMSLEEAKSRVWDYFHPADCLCGDQFETWIRYGRKPERERPEILGIVAESDAPPMKSMTVLEFRAAGGSWPPPPSLLDDVLDLSDRREELEREISGAESLRILAKALGASHGDVDVEEQRNRSHLKRIKRALVGISTSARGPTPRESTYTDDEFKRFLEEVTKPLLGQAHVSERMVVLRMPMERTAFRAGLERLGLTWPILRERIRRGGPIL